MVNLTRLSDATDRLAQTLAPESAGQVPGSNTEVRSADPAVVDSDALTAETDIELPDTPAPTGVDGELGRLEDQATRDEETFAQETERRAQQAQTQAETSVGEYLNTLVNQQTESELQQEAQTAAVVSGRSYDEIRGELNSINNRIQGEQHSLRRKIERIQDNPEGLSRAGIEARVNQEKRKSARYQADLAIQKTAIQGDFTLAKDIADRAVDAQLEQQQLELDAKKFILDKNWDLFTTAEQRAFQTQLNEEEREYEIEKDRLKQISDLTLEALTNGAPREIAAQMQESESVQAAMRLGGEYIGLLQRRKAAASIAASNASRRKNLMALALEGDRQSIDELGYDPREGAGSLTTEEVLENEQEYSKNQEDIKRAERLIENTRGLESVSGRIRSPYISGLFSGGKAEGAGTLTRFAPIIGNVQGAVQSKNDAEDFLADVNYVVNNLTLDKFLKLKEGGATFGAMSEGEWRIIGAAANELDAMAIKDGNRIIGFAGSEDKVAEELEKIKQQYEVVQDRLNMESLTSSEQDEITKIYNGEE